jgi:hypothetical protein
MGYIIASALGPVPLHGTAWMLLWFGFAVLAFMLTWNWCPDTTRIFLLMPKTQHSSNGFSLLAPFAVEL